MFVFNVTVLNRLSFQRGFCEPLERIWGFWFVDDNNIVSIHLNVFVFSPAECSGPIYRSRAPTRRPADIPPIDPTVLLDLQKHTQEVAHSVEMMMRSLNGTIQNVSLPSSSFNKTSALSAWPINLFVPRWRLWVWATSRPTETPWTAWGSPWTWV